MNWSCKQLDVVRSPIYWAQQASVPSVEDCLVLVCKLILYLCSCKDHPVA